MQAKTHELEAEGIAFFAISYDPVETLGAFAEQHDIGYPLLSDHGSVVIRELGIFNDTVAPDSRSYGIPWPGTYVIDADGRVLSKVFHESNYVRDATSTSLREQLTIDLGDGRSVEWHGERLSVVASLDTDAYVRQRRIGWRVRIALDDGVHVYATPLPEGFIPTTLDVNVPEGVIVDGIAYPQPFEMAFPFVDGSVPTYSGAFEIVGALIFQDTREDVEVTFDLGYQTCTDNECFASENVRLTIPVRYEPFA